MDLRFHRLAHARRYRWWRLPLAGVVGLIAYFLLQLWIVAAMWIFEPEFLNTAHVDLSQPLPFAFAMMSIALLLPFVYFALFIVRYVPVGRIASVTGRLRWAWLGHCLLLAGSVLGIGFVASFGLAAGLEPDAVAVPRWGARSAAMIALALALVPLQSAAEEFVFRGYLLQLFGSWFANPVIATLLTVPCFAVLHLYDLIGLVDVAVFGLAAGYLTWLTGGLEAAIAAHVVNNVILFLMGAVSMINVNATQGSWLGIATTAVVMAVYCAVVRRRVQDTGLDVVFEVREDHVVT